MIAGALLQIIAYSVQTTAPPFPAFVTMNFLNGMGLALQVSSTRLRGDPAADLKHQDAQANGFVGALSNVETKMGFVHCAYGLCLTTVIRSLCLILRNIQAWERLCPPWCPPNSLKWNDGHSIISSPWDRQY
jgi:hypothetical protein